MTDRKSPTDSLITRAKREAKRLTSTGITHGQALDAQAVLAGYPDWRTLAMANDKRKVKKSDAIAIDPVLPENFDNTPNDQRSKAELNQWWNRPFIMTTAEDGFEVRCLDGGASDRSTWYGTAKTLEEAKTLAVEKLSKWQKYLMTPVCRIRPDGLIDLVVLNPRPGVELKIVASGLKPDVIQAEINKLKIGRNK